MLLALRALERAKTPLTTATFSLCGGGAGRVLVQQYLNEFL